MSAFKISGETKAIKTPSSGCLGCLFSFVLIFILLILNTTYEWNLFWFFIPAIVITVVWFIVQNKVFVKQDKLNIRNHRTKNETFFQHTVTETDAPYLHVLAYLMQANGKISREKNKFVLQQLRSVFGKEQAGTHGFLLSKLLKKTIDVQLACTSLLTQIVDVNERKLIVHSLFAVASCDGGYTDNDHTVLQQIADYMQLTADDFGQIAAAFSHERTFVYNEQNETSYATIAQQKLDNAYVILGVSGDVSNDQLRDTYRALAKEYHPDRVFHLGEAFVRQAQERFQIINAAYELIKQERNIK